MKNKNPICKAQKRLKEIYLVKQQPTEQPQKSHEQDILQKHLEIDRSLRPTESIPLIILRLWRFLCVEDVDAEVTKSLTFSNFRGGCLRNISNMRCSVSSPDETPRRELKIRRAAEYF